jgi:hypothetical protein
MNLFTIQDYKPVPSDEVYMIEPFAKLFTLAYNKGPGDNQGRKRTRGVKELRFIYFYCAYTSEYAKYPDKDRMIKSLEAAGLDFDYKLSKELHGAIREFRSLKESRPVKLLNASRNAVDKLTSYFNSVELTKEVVNAEGATVQQVNPDVNAKDVMANLANLGKVLKGLDDLEDHVKKQEGEPEARRGDATPGRLR